jgi:hypothetical protein
MAAIHCGVCWGTVGVVNCRLDGKRLALWYSSVPELASDAVVCAECTLIFVIR